LLVFEDGRIAVLTPPEGKLEGGTLVFLAPRRGSSPLVFPHLPADIERAVASGVWLDGFEERSRGVFGGWVDASGTMLGVQVGEDGDVVVGAYVRDQGQPMVSGRYGLGWSASRRGYQTVDGGMTWASMTGLPDALPGTRERACGPVGCTAAGWIRLGWGPTEVRVSEMPARPVPRAASYGTAADLDLECEPVDAPPPQAQSFFGVPLPPTRAEDTAVRAESSSLVDRSVRVGPQARIIAWGPRSEDWARVGRWEVQWLWPYGGPHDVRSTLAAVAPFPTLDAARQRLLGTAGAFPGPIAVSWSTAAGDDPSDALLIGKRWGTSEITSVLAVEAERAPIEVHRTDGEPFGNVDFALRAGGHWYIITAPSTSYRPALLYRVDGAEAKELAQIPRTSTEAHPRLARRADGRSLGVVVDGQPPGTAERWVMPIDLESGVSGQPESLGSADLRDRRQLLPCSDGAVGWTLDTPWGHQEPPAATARIDLGAGQPPFTLRNLYARVTLSSHDACVLRLSGAFAGDANASAHAPASVDANHATQSRTSLPVSVAQGQGRRNLRCREKTR
jgi:hypothetical protein